MPDPARRQTTSRESLQHTHKDVCRCHQQRCTTRTAHERSRRAHTTEICTRFSHMEVRTKQLRHRGNQTYCYNTKHRWSKPDEQRRQLPVRSQPGAGVYPRRVWMHNSNQRLVTGTCDYAASHRTFGREKRNEGYVTKKNPLVEQVVTTAGKQDLLPMNTTRGSARGRLVNERLARQRTYCASQSSAMHGMTPTTSPKSVDSAGIVTTSTPIHAKAKE